MGASSSKTKEFRCPHCAIAKPPKTIGQPPHSYLLCVRCHGLVTETTTPTPTKSAALNPLAKRSSASAVAASGAYAALPAESKDSIEGHPSSSSSSSPPSFRLPLERIHIAPFFETLPPEHQAFASSLNYEQEMLDNYLTEYFTQLGKLFDSDKACFVQIGQRFQIKEVDFKVTSCYPPLGFVSDKTSIRCLQKPLSAIATIAKMHVLPVQSTLPFTAGPEGEPRYEQMDPNDIFRDYVRPWIQESSTVGAATQHQSVRARPTPTPAAASSSSSSSATVASASSSSSSVSRHENVEYDKHIIEGDMFVVKGRQFKIISCMPSNGCLTNDTEIFTAGPPVPDIARMQIHPIYESLPNPEKNWTGPQFFTKYLLPFFQGRFQFIKNGETLNIDGVDFKIIACEPPSGLVTSDTLIFNDGPPLRAEDIRRQQEEEDAAMARQLQMQEEVQNRPRGLGGRQVLMFGDAGLVNGATAGEMRGRLLEAVRHMPPQDPTREGILRLVQLLEQIPPNVVLPIGGGDRSIMSLVRSAGGPAQPNRGASEAEIDILPTRIYHAPAGSAADQEKEKERITCMVCLSEFEEGEELRTLPCFHSYHKACIDEWLKRNKTCPQCKKSDSRQIDEKKWT